jgi:cbb3-type cytochrome oxidase subunit 1
VDWFVKAFVRASLLWFALGISLGLAMGAYPPWTVYRPAHAHMTVAGFITMMVFGVGYQLLPRLFGHRLSSATLAAAHWWLSNVGLAAMIAGFVLRVHDRGPHAFILTAGGVLFSAGAFLFVFNLWRTFDLADERYRARAGVPNSGRKLPALDEADG